MDPGEMNMLPMWEVIPTRARVVDPSYNPAWSSGMVMCSRVELRTSCFGGSVY
jgi:hypothetical protein